MNHKRILWGIVWIGWGVFWGVIVPEVIVWPIGWSIAMLMLGIVGFAFVSNWWAPNSGLLTFWLGGVGMTALMMVWSRVSTTMESGGANLFWGIFLSILLWGYISIFIFKVGATLEAKYNPDFFNAEYLQYLRDGKQWP